MNIAYIATSEIPSQKANSIQVMKVCQALQQNGNQVHLYVPGRAPINWDQLSAEYGVQKRFPISRMAEWRKLRHLDFAWRSLKAAQRSGAEVVYTRMLWVGWFAQRLGMSVILEMHDLPTGKAGPRLYRSIVRSRRQKLLVYITSALKRLTDTSTGCAVGDHEFIIAPDGVDLERYQNLPTPGEAREQLNLSDRLTAAYSGSFYEGRGLDALVELARAFPKVHFLWIGGTAAAVADWKEKLLAEGLKNVTLTGFIKNAQLPLYQAAADILLIPYSRKVAGSRGGDIAAVNSPLKLFEYMAAGRAILCSDLPVLREVLNETNAVFYTPEDLGDMTAGFDALVKDEGKRQALAAQALSDVNQYEWKARMQKIMQAYLITS